MIISGTKTELEHKSTFRFLRKYAKTHHGHLPSNLIIAKKIAGNHIHENPQYYKKLKKAGL